ncbi:MAG: hypothetical protein C5B50_04905 [Verrucomicrobia bacterium]|nr:MAG: hypothetical protein C5B50_04905 [Verrucomicrobiota bacterium]
MGSEASVKIESEGSAHDQTERVCPGLSDLRLKRILVPVDFSHCSRKALNYAVAFAKSFQAEIILLNVPETAPVPPHQFVVETGDLETELRKQAASQLAQWRQSIPQEISARTVTLASLAADQEIVDLARENDVDLIVMGTHGRKGIAHLLIGSTAERVVRNAPCPVLVVRLREHDFVAEGAVQSPRSKVQSRKSQRPSRGPVAIQAVARGRGLLRARAPALRHRKVHSPRSRVRSSQAGVRRRVVGKE